MNLHHAMAQTPRLILNNPAHGQRVSTVIRRELESCRSFRFYVAFANQEGVATLLQTLRDLRDKGVTGKVLVSQYLNFTDPIALRTLLKLQNVEVRIATKGSVHAKGYFFEREDCDRFIVGSSNWTAAALATNTELNIRIEANHRSPISEEVAREFDLQFERAERLTEEFLRHYEALYREIWETAAKTPGVPGVTADRDPQWHSKLRPNAMQSEALAALAKLREAGETRALIISATGTGKTYLSAFDVCASQARRMLFVVHRENIARAALKSFERVLGGERSCGMYTGNRQELDADFVFCTVQTLSRPENLSRFDAEAFDYIVVDESHRAGAASYARFLSHFRPRFLLGMTATPERTDGADIFSYFDHNIGYEIRLQRALEEEMLCPFHYFGMTDLALDGEIIDDKSDFNRLACPERVERILEKAAFYGCYDGVVRGLVFCSRVEEARSLSDEFNRRGYKTVALDGSSGEGLREQSIRRLEADPDSGEKIDYIFTVDIFNEGVDIPLCNQVIFLRPTQSAIVFVQQLGRGLRRIDGRNKYLTVIDFIGNYENNFMIPIALYGDRTYDKDKLRKLVLSGSEGLPGTSTVNFEAVARDRIFASINSAQTRRMRDLRADFDSLRLRIGRVPLMQDFLDHDLRDPIGYADVSGPQWEHRGSFYAFSRRIAPDVVPLVGPVGGKILAQYTADALNGKCLEEPLLLGSLLANNYVSRDALGESFEAIVGYRPEGSRWESAQRSLNLRFLREPVGGRLVTPGDRLGVELVRSEGEGFCCAEDLHSELRDQGFRLYLQDLCRYATGKFLRDFQRTHYVKGFVRYRKYGRSDVFRILGARENPVAQNVGGYMVSPDKSWCPIFVTYHKKKDIAASTQYEDEFLNPSELAYFSKSNRSLRSPDVVFLRTATPAVRIPIFVQKSNDEGIEFYYLGDGEPDPQSFEPLKMKSGNDAEIPVVRMTIALDQPIEDGLYNYIVSAAA